MTSPHNPTSSGNEGERGLAQLPSFEERAAADGDYPFLSDDARLILWTLNSPLTEAISVMQRGLFDPDNTEPYHRGDPGGWHPISQSPLTTPKISSVTIRVDPLDEWAYYWLENHRGHTDPDCDSDPAEYRFGPLSNSGEYEREGEVHLLVCCGEQRPRNKGTKLLVQATGDFLTVHDFLSVVHPYLMGRRDDLIAALGEHQLSMGEQPYPANSKLMVSWDSPKDLDVMEEDEWLQIHGNPKKGNFKTMRSPEAEEVIRQALAANRQRRAAERAAAQSQ